MDTYYSDGVDTTEPVMSLRDVFAGTLKSAFGDEVNYANVLRFTETLKHNIKTLIGEPVDVTISYEFIVEGGPPKLVVHGVSIGKLYISFEEFGICFQVE